MVEKYDEILDGYIEHIENKSQYDAWAVKNGNNTSPHFPIAVCSLSNNIDTDYCSNEKMEFYEGAYFTINLFAGDKEITKTEIINEEEIETYETIPAQVIINELIELTIQYFGGLNMKRTLNKPTPNLDTSILRQTIQYQSLIGTRGNIIRR